VLNISQLTDSVRKEEILMLRFRGINVTAPPSNRPFSWPLAAAMVTIGLAATVLPSARADVDYNLNFTASDQPMFSFGNGSVSNDYFLGTSWNSASTGGQINCSQQIFDICIGHTGVQYSLSTNGTAGIDFKVTTNSGSVSAAVPADIKFQLPTQVTPGTNFTVGSTLNVGQAQLATSSPNLSVTGSLVLDAHANFSATLCAEVCDTVGAGVNINNVNQQLFSVSAQDLKLGVPIKIPSSGPTYGNINLSFPGIDTTGFEDLNSGLTTSSGQANFLTATADLVNIGATLADLPPINASLSLCSLPGCSLSYNLLEANVGGALGFGQDFTMSNPDQVSVGLKVLETGQLLPLDAGSSGQLFFPADLTQLHIQPIFSLVPPNLDVNTFLTADPLVNLKALSACLFAVVCAGPLVDETTQFSGIQIPINDLDNSSALTFDQVYGDIFTVNAGDNSAAQNPGTDLPEPGASVWTVLALAALGLVRWPKTAAGNQNHRPAA